MVLASSQSRNTCAGELRRLRCDLRVQLLRTRERLVRRVDPFELGVGDAEVQIGQRLFVDETRHTRQILDDRLERLCGRCEVALGDERHAFDEVGVGRTCRSTPRIRPTSAFPGILPNPLVGEPDGHRLRLRRRDINGPPEILVVGMEDANPMRTGRQIDPLLFTIGLEEFSIDVHRGLRHDAHDERAGHRAVGLCRRLAEDEHGQQRDQEDDSLRPTHRELVGVA